MPEPLRFTVHPLSPYAGFEPYEDTAPAPTTDPYAHFDTYQEPPPGPPTREIGMGEAAGRGFQEGVNFGLGPAIGGAIKAGENPDETEGQFSELRNTIRGFARLLHGDKNADAIYRKERDRLREEQEQTYEQNPLTYLGGQVAGAAATPLGASGGATTLGRVGSAAGSGALAGALGGAGGAISEGADPGDIAVAAGKGAGLGGMVGGAGGAILEGGAKIAGRLGDIIRGARSPENQAARGIRGALREDLGAGSAGIDPEAEAAARRAGLPILNIDRGGQTTGDLARTAGNVSPPAWGALEQATRERTEARPERLASAINRLFGGRLDAGADQLALQTQARAANRPAYARAYAAGDRPVWSPELERLTGAPSVQQAIKTAVTSGQDRSIEEGFGAFNPGISVSPDGRILMGQKYMGGAVRGTPSYPNMQFWDYVQRDLSDMIQKAEGREPDKVRYLTSIHHQLNNELDRIVPEFQAARQGAHNFFQAQDASEAGRNFVRMNADPREARRALAQMNPAQRELFARGFADELAQSVLRKPNTLGTIKSVFTSPAAVDKIRTALGAPRSREIEALMRAEAIAERSKQALGNSTTARQQEMIRAFKASGAAHGIAGAGAIGAFEFLHEGDFDPKSILGTALIIGAIKNGAHKVDTRVMRRIGEMLASDDPSIIRQGASAVAHSPVLFSALRRGTEAGTRVGVRDIGPDRALAGSAAILGKILQEEQEHHGASHDDGSDQGALGIAR